MADLSGPGWYVPVVGNAAYYPSKAAANKAFGNNGPAEAGPFASEAEANRWISQHGTSTGQVIGLGLGAGASAATANNVPNPFSWVGTIGHWIGDIALHIGDGAMWISIGWLLLGILLMIGGIYLWFRTSDAYKSLESSAAGVAAAL